MNQREITATVNTLEQIAGSLASISKHIESFVEKSKQEKTPSKHSLNEEYKPCTMTGGFTIDKLKDAKD